MKALGVIFLIGTVMVSLLANAQTRNPDDDSSAYYREFMQDICAWINPEDVTSPKNQSLCLQKGADFLKRYPPPVSSNDHYDTAYKAALTINLCEAHYPIEMIRTRMYCYEQAVHENGLIDPPCAVRDSALLKKVGIEYPVFSTPEEQYQCLASFFRKILDSSKAAIAAEQDQARMKQALERAQPQMAPIMVEVNRGSSNKR